jgi:hypothetical protein
MQNHFIYQIFYNEASRLSNDRGFIQLDNSLNERPDWSEYWPIRNFFKNNMLDDNKYYGFFSPKFNQKTNLTSDDVFNFCNNSTTDVVSFSPYFDQAAYALNIFEQATANHEGIREHISNIFKLLNTDINIFSIVMPASNTIFCNYFVAKPSFWHEWFYICEYLYAQAENKSSDLYESLNTLIIHSGKYYPVKVFAIERIASYIISIKSSYTIKSFNSLSMPFSGAIISKNKDALVILNSLKEAFHISENQEYLVSFFKNRSNLFK